jgi:ElaB/YqjD/DUF883 family membrane-anchored ribosome-binding protein
MKATANHHFETPKALRHDANTIVEDARDLMEATSEMADEKVTAARHGLTRALATGKGTYGQLQKKVKVADRAVHNHPYQAMGVAFGVGALAGLLLWRRR